MRQIFRATGWGEAMRTRNSKNKARQSLSLWRCVWLQRSPLQGLHAWNVGNITPVSGCARVRARARGRACAHGRARVRVRTRARAPKLMCGRARKIICSKIAKLKLLNLMGNRGHGFETANEPVLGADHERYRWYVTRSFHTPSNLQ